MASSFSVEGARGVASSLRVNLWMGRRGQRTLVRAAYGWTWDASALMRTVGAAGMGPELSERSLTSHPVYCCEAAPEALNLVSGELRAAPTVADHLCGSGQGLQ